MSSLGINNKEINKSSVNGGEVGKNLGRFCRCCPITQVKQGRVLLVFQSWESRVDRDLKDNKRKEKVIGGMFLGRERCGLQGCNSRSLEKNCCG